MPWYNLILITVRSIVWGNCGKTLSEKLQKMQNRAARILTSSFYNADARYLLQQLGWKELITQRQIQVASVSIIGGGSQNASSTILQFL